jgi:hypothetical protein
VLGWVVMIVVGLVAAAILSPLYALICEASGWVYIYFIAPVVFAGAMGWPIAIAARLAKVRHETMPMVVAAICGLFSLYLIWVFTIAAKFDLDDLIFSLGGIFSHMRALAAQDYSIHKIGWETASWDYPGWVRWIMWFLEAVVIVGGPAVAVAVKGKYHLPFCERCNRYCETEEQKAFTHISPQERAEFVKRLEQGDYSVLEKLNRIDPTRKRRTEMELVYCPKCKQMHLLSIETIDEDFDTDEAVQQDGQSETVVNNILVTAEVHKMIRAKKRQPRQKKKGNGDQPGQDQAG